MQEESQRGGLSGWLRLGVLAGVSALAGGVAAAWWYRKTLVKLRQAGEEGPDPDFGSAKAPGPDEE